MVKTYWGSGGVAPHINLGTRWKWLVSFMSQPLYSQGKNSKYPLDRRLDWPQTLSCQYKIELVFQGCESHRQCRKTFSSDSTMHLCVNIY